MIPSVAIAKLDRNDVTEKYCRVCETMQEGTVYSNIDSSETEHKFEFRCKTCGNTTRIIESHSGGGATCTTAGTCVVCGASYKDPDNHEYVWKDNGDGTHTGQCKTHPNETTSGEHIGGNATCVSTGTCKVCNLSYTDPTITPASAASSMKRSPGQCTT